MPSVYLIRHGQASFGQENYDQLSELGCQQASHLGEHIKPRIPQFDAIGMGTMQRHRQTAELCLQAMGQTPDFAEDVQDDGWNEYDHQNILAQLGPDFATPDSINAWVRQQTNPAGAFEQAFNDAVQRWMSADEDPAYVESWQTFRGRIHAALDNIVAAQPGARHIGVFTSGGPISLLSQHLLGVPEQKLMAMNWTLVNCGLTKVVASSSRRFVATLNDHVHFEGEHRHLLTYK